MKSPALAIVGESMREVGVLWFAFGILDEVMKERAFRPAWIFAVAAGSIFLIGVGAWLHQRHRS